MVRLVLVDGWKVEEVALYYGVSEATVNRAVAAIRLSGYVPPAAEPRIDIERVFA